MVVVMGLLVAVCEEVCPLVGQAGAGGEHMQDIALVLPTEGAAAVFVLPRPMSGQPI